MSGSGVALSHDQWVARIRRKLSATVEQIIEVGVDLEAAKAQLGHGRWEKLLTACDMDKRTAQRFMAIASHPVLANTTTWSYLPASYRTLAELARIDEAVLEKAIRDGEVTRETRTRDAEELYQRYYGRSTTTTSRETTTTTTTPPVADGTRTTSAPLADENGEPLPTGSEPREDAEVSDGAGASADEGVGSTTHDPAPSAPSLRDAAHPDDSYRSRMSREFAAVRNGLLQLTVDRMLEVSDLERRGDIEETVKKLRAWCDAVDAGLNARPRMEMVK